ncbi:MAG: glycerophosphoryl diester phosphodiesterase [Frankiales bacterium]|nr:glycerophosphoryl diester phosphodiesterase [Frankiales bacterium]
MLLLAHRGLTSAGNPEDSAQAVAAARRAGADGCEVDLRLSADGVLLASHDDDLLRVAGVPVRVSTSSSAQLRAVPLPGGARLARVAELVEAVDGGRLVLELKRPASGRPGPTALALAGELRSLRRRGRDLDVVVSSFSGRLVATVRALGVPVRTALLGAPGEDCRQVLARAAAGRHDEVHPHAAALLADPCAVEAARAAGLDVVAWTVNDPGDAARLHAAGVTAVITDVPVLLQARSRQAVRG